MEMLFLILSAIAEDRAKVIFLRVKEGDPQALADLYDLFGKLLHVVIFRIVISPRNTSAPAMPSMVRPAEVPSRFFL